MTITEYNSLSEQDRQVALINCPYCGKELVGRLFCNHVHRERYRARWRRQHPKKELRTPETLTEQALVAMGFEELELPKIDDVPTFGWGTFVRRKFV